MNTRLLTMSVALLGLLLPTSLIAQEPLLPPAANPARPPAEPMPDNEGDADGVQALTRGPVHEAFAEPFSVEPAPGLVVPQQPPNDIEELPPEARPDDANAEWISGYWVWNEEESNFLWVSGIWRSVPSGMRWVPGYWTQVDGGFQRAGGFWASATNAEVLYLPDPPETVETGPNVPAPSADHFWVTGCWMWEGGRYQWRGGYWARVQPDWVWSPAHYSWTPRGCVFVNGYWDYPLDRRGVIFAPMHFHSSVYSRPGFVYTPSVIINAGFLTSHFFVRPNNNHYYFGDYYGDQYARFGFQPWFAFQKTRGWQDPIFAHQRWRHGRDGDDWTERLATNHRFFAENKDLRPRHTFAEQARFSQQLAQRNDANLPKDFIQQVALGTSVRDALSGDARLGQSLQRVPDAQRRELRERSNQMRDLAQQRVQTEAKVDRQADARNRPGTEGRELGRFKLPAVAGGPGNDNRPGPTANERGPAGAASPGTDPQNANRPNAGRPGVDQPDRTPRPELTQPRDRNPQLPNAPAEAAQPSDRTDRRPALPGADRLPDPNDRRTTPDAERSRIPLPGAERQPSRIPGGTPGIGPSQTPAGQGAGTGANRDLPNKKDRTLPDAERSRIPLPGAERQPSRIPGGTPGIGPSQTPAGQGGTRSPQPGPTRVEAQRPTSPATQARQLDPQPRVNRGPEPSRSPQPRVEAQRPSNPTPAPQARSAPSGGGRSPAAPSPGRSSGGSGGGNKGDGGGNKGAGGNPGKGNDKKN